LGLSICQAVVAAHHGRILCESELGKGSTMIVELPLHVPGKTPQSADAGQIVRNASSASVN
jgi:signal transduction histidine kinase